MQTLNIYNMEKTIGMMQKTNIKLPSPTKFDGRYPQFNEWSGEVKAYIGVHNVDECTKFVTAMTFRTRTLQKRSENPTTYSQTFAEGEDGHDSARVARRLHAPHGDSQKDERWHCQIQSDKLCVATCFKARQ
eukprot:115856-Amphidinium_carterae.1